MIIKYYFTGIKLARFILALLKLVDVSTNFNFKLVPQLVSNFEKTLLSSIPANIKILARDGRVSLKIAILWGIKIIRF